MRTPVRQGDVILVPAKIMPGDLKAVPRDNGRVILAYGESTGHAHAFRSPAVTFFRPDDAGAGGGWLSLAEPALLEHEEHTALLVPAGLYRVGIQVEETPEAVRRVED